MSNVIGFKVFKNTLKRDSGYAPVSGENGYSVIRCVFPSGGDWENVTAVSAGFFVHPKDIASVTVDITDGGEERTAEFTIPGALLKQGERLHFGLFATVDGVTIATNTVALDVARGIISEDIDYDPEEAASMFEQFSNALNTALLGKADKLVNGDNAFTDRILIASNNGGIKNSGYTINNARLSGDVNLTVPSSNLVANALAGKADKAADGTDGELAALDSNGALKRSGVTVAQSVGGGSADKVPTTAAVKNALNEKANKAAAGTDGELAALDDSGALKRSGVTVAQSVGEGSADKVPTTEAVRNALNGKADKAAAGSAGELAALDANGSPIRSNMSVALSIGEGSNSKVPTTSAVKNALDGKADKAANGTDGELAALDANGAMKRSGVSVAESVGGGSNNMVPTTAAVKLALDGKADKAAAGTVGELAAFDGVGALKRSGFNVAPSIGRGRITEVPTTAAVKLALDGKADKAPTGAVGELAAVDGNGALIRSGVSVTQSVDAGGNSKVPTTEAVKTALNGKADKLSSGGGGELVSATGGGEIQRSGFFVSQSIGSGAANMVPTTAAVKLALNGAGIASGVVNQNGTISFYDAGGNLLFTTTGTNIVTSGNQQIGMGYDNGGFYFLLDDGQEAG